MGSFTVQFEIANRNGGEFAPVEAMADTGSIYTFIPDELLRRLGVQPLQRRTFFLADDSEVNYDMGEALFRLEDMQFTAPVIFAPDGVTPLLGVTALEIFGLGVDPVNERLISIPLPLKSVSVGPTADGSGRQAPRHRTGSRQNAGGD
jgi:clan AA aspartic protease